LLRRRRATAFFGMDSYKRYLFALLGLRAEAGVGGVSTQQFSAEQTSTIQAPVLCNLAACKLGLAEYDAAEQLCSVVLALSEDSVPQPLRFKALARRCKARLLNNNFGGSSADCQAVQMLASALGTPEHLDQAARLQREVVRRREETSRRREAQRVSWSQSLQDVDLYADKPIAGGDASPDYHSDNSEEDGMEEVRAEEARTPASVCQRLMQCLFRRMGHHKTS